MLHYTDGDLLYCPLDVIVHQTNCQGVMGAGLAKQIARQYPNIVELDREYCKSGDVLGTNLYVTTYDKYIVNMYAQRYYGTKRRHTDYNAFRMCLSRLAHKLQISSPDLRVGFPYGIGCGLAGGDWIVIEKMIKDFAENVMQDVYIVKREE